VETCRENTAERQPRKNLTKGSSTWSCLKMG
jgi:hypothetical protein